MPIFAPARRRRRRDRAANEAGRALFRHAAWWLAVSAAARSRRPVRALARPLPGLAAAVPIVPLTFVSLIASEFPLHVILGETAWASRLVRGGALGGTRGRIGLAVATVAWWLLLEARRDALRADEVLEASLQEALRDDLTRAASADGIEGKERPTWPDVWLPRFTERARYLCQEDLSYGGVAVRNDLDIWRRRDLSADAHAPVLIQIHGSAWVAGSKRGQGYPLMAHLAERGWVCVAINYSLAPAAHWPAHVIDVKRAIAWVKREISAHGGDPGFIAVTGGSAGGHLSSLAALTANDPVFQPGFEDEDTSVQAAVPLYGVYDLLDRAGDSPPQQDEFLRRIVIGASRVEAYPVWEQGSPLSHIRPDAPPMFIIHGDLDTFTNPEQARAFAKALGDVSSNPVAYAELPGTQHSFDCFPTPRTGALVRRVGGFLTHMHCEYQAAEQKRTPL